MKLSIAILCVAVSACISEPRSETGNAQQPVINGTESGSGDYPNVGALVLGSSPNYQFYCSGTLIHPQVVLTAAHCVDPLFISGSTVGFTLALDANSVGPADVVEASATVAHPSFDIGVEPATGVQVWYDIGLVFLNQAVTSVSPAAVATPTEAAGLAVGTEVELVGYGYTTVENTDPGGVKYHGAGDMVEIGSHEVQVSMPGQQQNCRGDSGGPGFVDFGSGLRLVGVVSRSPDPAHFDCDIGGIDTRADAYLDWINATIAEQLGAPDAGVTPDASVTPDAMLEPDAMTDNPGDVDGGGCGCRTSGSAPGSSAALILIVGALLWRRRRR